MSRLSVSIIVVTRNRAQILKRQLAHLTTMFERELVAGTSEILIFDDASTDETAAVCDAFPGRIRCHKSLDQVGCIEGRRRLLRAAQGDYIVQLDDDSYLLDRDALGRVREFFTANQRCAVIAGNVATIREPAGLFPVAHPPNVTGTFVACACAFRARALCHSGYYPEFLAGMQAEEQAMSLCLLDDGFDVMMLPALRFFHAEDPTQRPIVQRRAEQLANETATIVALYPFVLVGVAIAYKILRYLLYNLRQRTLASFLPHACPLLLSAAHRGVRHRRPIRTRTLVLFHQRQRRSRHLRKINHAVSSGPTWPEPEMLFADAAACI